MMFNKLSIKMTFLYGLIIIITIVYLIFILMFKYEDNQFKKNEIEYLSYVNMFSNLLKDDMSNITSLIDKTPEYGKSIDGRILVLNSDGYVISDEYNKIIGEKITNKEMTSSIDNKDESMGYYKMDNEYIMIITAPILQINEVVGVVLISTSVTHIKQDVQSLRNQAAGISVIAIIIAFVLLIFTGKKITKPVSKLTDASQSILKGQLNTKVDITRKDEIGKLALTFNKMSEELYKLDENRRRFITNVSHELKTPLASIKALIESLINSKNDIDTYNEYLADVNVEIDRLSGLVKSLLAVARLEEEKIKKEPMNLYLEIQKIIRMFEPLTNEKNINIINKCKEDIVIVADKYKFKEVIINLIDNGIKYNRDNGYVEISYREKMWRKMLIVRDSGQGIPKEDINLIFDNFYRVDKSRKNEKGGSGIGLYIVKKIIDLHQWSITVNSQLGKGTEFIIEIG
ncbi:MAG: HAMP domain-containing histidine kinase [Firmicutes bacterium]|nr:HAMP domain-containing histidine kinase [Bacillota bacterium]